MKRSRLPVVVAVLLAVIVTVAGVVVILRGQQSSAAPQRLECLGGSEKAALMDDPEIRAILREKYGLEVRFTTRGSYDLVQIPTEQLRTQRVDCLWPSSASARSLFEETHGPDDFPDYRAESVLETPEVIYAGAAATDALVRAGIVALRDNAYHVVDFKRLLLDHVLPARRWSELGTADPAGPIRITSTDPGSSNSGFTLLQLELSVIASGDIFQPPTPAQARAGLPTIRALYDAQGLQSDNSDGGFREWLIQGATSLYAGYENQVLQQLVAYRGDESSTKALLAEVRLLYPDPTIFNSNPVLALTAPAQGLITALRDPAVGDIAWKRYGFRSADRLGAAQPGDYPQIPLAPQPRATPPPRADVTRLLLACVRENRCP